MSSWAQILLGTVLFFFSILSVVSPLFRPLKEVQHCWFSYKIKFSCAAWGLIRSDWAKYLLDQCLFRMNRSTYFTFVPHRNGIPSPTARQPHRQHDGQFPARINRRKLWRMGQRLGHVPGGWVDQISGLNESRHLSGKDASNFLRYRDFSIYIERERDLSIHTDREICAWYFYSSLFTGA